jgi:hypothetical protein
MSACGDWAKRARADMLTSSCEAVAALSGGGVQMSYQGRPADSFGRLALSFTSALVILALEERGVSRLAICL